MILFLTSNLNTHIKDEDGNKFPIPLGDNNLILTNIKKNLKNLNKIVWICNNPNDFENNDKRSFIVFESFKLAGLDFNEKIILDKRNYKKSKDILKDASIIIICGGKIIPQLKFLKKIKLKKFLKSYNGIVIGISAGTMNLCKKIFNFPEEISDINEKRILKGLNLFKYSIIPHFDGLTKSYQIECPEIDIVNNYIIPYSKKFNFIGIPNESYIMIDNEVKYYGNIYTIFDEKIKSHN